MKYGLIRNSCKKLSFKISCYENFGKLQNNTDLQFYLTVGRHRYLTGKLPKYVELLFLKTLRNGHFLAFPTTDNFSEVIDKIVSSLCLCVFIKPHKHLE